MFDSRFDNMLPTQPIGSIPRTLKLIQAMAAHETGQLPEAELEARYRETVRDTAQKFEATGSPVICKGKQRKVHKLATDCVHGGGSSRNGQPLRRQRLFNERT